MIRLSTCQHKCLYATWTPSGWMCSECFDDERKAKRMLRMTISVRKIMDELEVGDVAYVTQPAKQVTALIAHETNKWADRKFTTEMCFVISVQHGELRGKVTRITRVA